MTSHQQKHQANPAQESSSKQRRPSPAGQEFRLRPEDIGLRRLQQAAAAPAAAAPDTILRLQHLYGNQTVSRRLQQAGPAPGIIQAKLTVGPVGDKYEQEADRVADQVMRMPAPTVQRQEDEEELQMKPAGTIQRQEDEEELQMKPAGTIQRQEDEEELQMKPAEGIQRQEDEEELQMKPAEGIQRQEDEEELQMKPAEGIQRQEDEEELQMKPAESIQRQEDEDELQMKPAEGIQRQEDEDELQMKPAAGRKDGSFEAGAGIERRLAGLKGGGQPLPAGLRTDMEARFGADFSRVRVHTGGEAAKLNRSLQAKAFTHGRDIYFASGQYTPGSGDGKRLLAHELTHVIQQTGRQPRPSHRREPSTENRSTGPVVSPASAGAVQRAIWDKYGKTKEEWDKLSSEEKFDLMAKKPKDEEQGQQQSPQVKRRSLSFTKKSSEPEQRPRSVSIGSGSKKQDEQPPVQQLPVQQLPPQQAPKLKGRSMSLSGGVNPIKPQVRPRALSIGSGLKKQDEQPPVQQPQVQPPPQQAPKLKGRSMSLSGGMKSPKLQARRPRALSIGSGLGQQQLATTDKKEAEQKGLGARGVVTPDMLTQAQKGLRKTEGERNVVAEEKGQEKIKEAFTGEAREMEGRRSRTAKQGRITKLKGAGLVALGTMGQMAHGVYGGPAASKYMGMSAKEASAGYALGEKQDLDRRLQARLNRSRVALPGRKAGTAHPNQQNLRDLVGKEEEEKAPSLKDLMAAMAKFFQQGGPQGNQVKQEKKDVELKQDQPKVEKKKDVELKQEELKEEEKNK